MSTFRDFDDMKDPECALETGRAGEHFVCYDLWRRGYRAYFADHSLPYDLVVDLRTRLVRVQVKASISPRELNAKGRSRRLGYGFHVRRRGKFGQTVIADSEADIMAFVALDVGLVSYCVLKSCPTTVSFNRRDLPYPTKKHQPVQFIGEASFPDALAKL